MKKVLAIGLAVVLVMTMGAGTVLAGKDLKGNGVPSGPHYNLNLIGMENPKNADFDGGNGHRIFVKLSKTDRVTTKIYLQEGDFAVIDANGTDGTARFQLPNPDPDNTGTTLYSVYLRVLGKPGGDIIMDTRATDPITGEEVVSVLQVIEVRDSPAHGNNKFSNVSKELLYIYAYVAVGTDPDTGEYIYEFMRVPLFSSLLEDYLWNYDNNGLRIAQLRFYEVPNTVPEPGDVEP